LTFRVSQNHWKNYKFILYPPISKQINVLIHINNFFNTICYQLANKTRNLLLAKQLLIYIIYDDKTTIGFVGFVANLLNRSTDCATVSVRKRVTFRPFVSRYLKLPFSLRVPKKTLASPCGAYTIIIIIRRPLYYESPSITIRSAKLKMSDMISVWKGNRHCNKL
jgi:hypothetical protein